jgi:hypothetical protein
LEFPVKRRKCEEEKKGVRGVYIITLIYVVHVVDRNWTFQNVMVWWWWWWCCCLCSAYLWVIDVLMKCMWCGEMLRVARMWCDEI